MIERQTSKKVKGVLTWIAPDQKRYDVEYDALIDGEDDRAEWTVGNIPMSLASKHAEEITNLCIDDALQAIKDEGESTATVKVVPKSNKSDAKAGWGCSLDFIHNTIDKVEEQSGLIVHEEQVEVVVLALQELGYLEVSQ